MTGHSQPPQRGTRHLAVELRRTGLRFAAAGVLRRAAGGVGIVRRGVQRTLWLAFFACCVNTGLPATGWALDYYVDNVIGSDRFDGKSPVSDGDSVGPFRSIARALQAARKGDRVVVANTGEPYRESITLQGARHSGLPHRPFQLLGNGAVLDGTCMIPAHSWHHAQGEVFCFQPPKTSYQIIYRNGEPVPRQEIESTDQLSQLKPLHWALIGTHVFFRVEPNRLPQSYDLCFAEQQVGVTLYEVRHVVLSDFVVQGFQLDGVNAHDGVSSAQLIKLNCRGNGRSGISIGGASRVVVKACLVGNNGSAQVRTEGYSHTQLVGCDLLDNTAPKLVKSGGQVDISE